jgi:hypothetical protein
MANSYGAILNIMLLVYLTTIKQSTYPLQNYFLEKKLLKPAYLEFRLAKRKKNVLVIIQKVQFGG